MNDYNSDLESNIDYLLRIKINTLANHKHTKILAKKVKYFAPLEGAYFSCKAFGLSCYDVRSLSKSSRRCRLYDIEFLLKFAL